jgi:hypothetical protein
MILDGDFIVVPVTINDKAALMPLSLQSAASILNKTAVADLKLRTTELYDMHYAHVGGGLV